MKYKLVISDFDGTLAIAPNSVIDDYTLDRIREFEKRGGKFLICTGRMKTSIEPICKRHGLTGLVVSYQGSLISDINTGEILVSAGIDYSTAIEIVNEMKSLGVQAQVYIDDQVYFDVYNEFSQLYERACSVKGKVVDDLIELIKKEKKNSLKVCGLASPERADQVVKILTERYPRLVFNKGASTLIEAVNPAYSKGKAVEFLANYYGVDHSQILTIGDSTNDITLIDGDWFGVAVGDGSEELKRVADHVTVPFDEHPVATVIQEYCLKD